MVSPLARGLFHRAIGQSGGMFSGGPGLVNDLKSAESAGMEFARQLNASSLAALRTLSAEELMKVRGQWGITTDNIVIPEATQVFREGRQNDVPLLWHSIFPAVSAMTPAYDASLRRLRSGTGMSG